jgi:hypothetical protein
LETVREIESSYVARNDPQCPGHRFGTPAWKALMTVQHMASVDLCVRHRIGPDWPQFQLVEKRLSKREIRPC